LTQESNLQEKTRYPKYLREVLLYSLVVVFTLPLASILNRFIPSIVFYNLDIDLLIAVILTFFGMKWLIFKYRKTFVVLSIIILLSQISGYFLRGYSFYHVFNDYRVLVHNLWNRQPLFLGTSLDVDSNIPDPKIVEIGERVKSKVSWSDSAVRNFSVLHCQDYFSSYENKYGYCVRYLSLFKHINSNFKYISDAKRDEYFATPSETIKVGLAGDCDDHSILMASCMKAIGGEVRLVIVEGHIYPELGFDGIDQFNNAVRAIDKLFHDDLKDYVHYHTDEGKYWINLDYSARHPGGPYTDKKVLYVMPI
jgi:hypothetical protein